MIRLMESGGQVRRGMPPHAAAHGESRRVWELVAPNPKLKLMDQVREVLRNRALPTSRDWEAAYPEGIPPLSPGLRGTSYPG